MPQAELDFTAFLKVLEKAKSVGLTAPAWGDGDSVGTQAALREILRFHFPKLEVRIINETPCPKKYTFLQEAEAFEVSKDVLAQDRKTWPEIMICVDGNFERIGDDTTTLWGAAKSRGQVDHHKITGANVYNFRLYDPKAAATTEIVFRLVEASKTPLTASIAQAIYLGLIFDTGLFKHSNTTPEIMRIAAKLLETKFDYTDTAEKGMLIRSPGAFKMLREVLATAHFDISNRYVWGALAHEAFLKAGGDPEDREGLIDQLFLTDQCEIAGFYFEPTPGQWKISFRSRKSWDVAALARSLNPEGGGHVRAAGCSLKGSQESVLNKCHQAVKSLLVSK
jgi:bifunctional oligoribonuclease and PAP phosphatase NrnA